MKQHFAVSLGAQALWAHSARKTARKTANSATYSATSAHCEDVLVARCEALLTLLLVHSFTHFTTRTWKRGGLPDQAALLTLVFVP